MFKNEKGVTLTALIITVIVLGIIAAVALFSGRDDTSKIKDEVVLAELEQVKNMVGENYLNYTKTGIASFLTGFQVSDSKVTQIADRINVTLIRIPDKYYINTEEKQPVARYYEVGPTQLEELGIKNSENTYIVNYLTGEVINQSKLWTSTGKPLYTYIRDIFDDDYMNPTSF